MRIFAGSEERSHKSMVFRLRLAIGVPGELLEGLPVPDNDVAPVRANKTVAFKDVERRCDAWTANRKHQRNELVRQRNLVAWYTVVTHQKPSGQSLVHPVQRVRNRSVGKLNREGLNATDHHPGEIPVKIHPLPECAELHPVAVSFDLHDDVVDAELYTHRSRSRNVTFTPEDTRLRFVTLRRRGDQGANPGREIINMVYGGAGCSDQSASSHFDIVEVRRNLVIVNLRKQVQQLVVNRSLGWNRHCLPLIGSRSTAALSAAFCQGLRIGVT